MSRRHPAPRDSLSGKQPEARAALKLNAVLDGRGKASSAEAESPLDHDANVDFDTDPIARELLQSLGISSADARQTEKVQETILRLVAEARFRRGEARELSLAELEVARSNLKRELLSCVDAARKVLLEMDINFMTRVLQERATCSAWETRKSTQRENVAASAQDGPLDFDDEEKVYISPPSSAATVGGGFAAGSPRSALGSPAGARSPTSWIDGGKEEQGVELCTAHNPQTGQWTPSIVSVQKRAIAFYEVGQLRQDASLAGARVSLPTGNSAASALKTLQKQSPSQTFLGMELRLPALNNSKILLAARSERERRSWMENISFASAFDASRGDNHDFEAAGVPVCLVQGFLFKRSIATGALFGVSPRWKRRFCRIVYDAARQLWSLQYHTAAQAQVLVPFKNIASLEEQSIEDAGATALQAETAEQMAAVTISLRSMTGRSLVDRFLIPRSTLSSFFDWVPLPVETRFLDNDAGDSLAHFANEHPPSEDDIASDAAGQPKIASPRRPFAEDEDETTPCEVDSEFEMGTDLGTVDEESRSDLGSDAEGDNCEDINAERLHHEGSEEGSSDDDDEDEYEEDDEDEDEEDEEEDEEGTSEDCERNPIMGATEHDRKTLFGERAVRSNDIVPYVEQQPNSAKEQRSCVNKSQDLLEQRSARSSDREGGEDETIGKDDFDAEAKRLCARVRANTASSSRSRARTRTRSRTSSVPTVDVPLDGPRPREGPRNVVSKLSDPPIPESSSTMYPVRETNTLGSKWPLEAVERVAIGGSSGRSPKYVDFQEMQGEAQDPFYNRDAAHQAHHNSDVSEYNVASRQAAQYAPQARNSATSEIDNHDNLESQAWQTVANASKLVREGMSGAIDAHVLEKCRYLLAAIHEAMIDIKTGSFVDPADTESQALGLELVMETARCIIAISEVGVRHSTSQVLETVDRVSMCDLERCSASAMRTARMLFELGKTCMDALAQSMDVQGAEHSRRSSLISAMEDWKTCRSGDDRASHRQSMSEDEVSAIESTPQVHKFEASTSVNAYSVMERESTGDNDEGYMSENFSDCEGDATGIAESQAVTGQKSPTSTTATTTTTIGDIIASSQRCIALERLTEQVAEDLLGRGHVILHKVPDTPISTGEELGEFGMGYLVPVPTRAPPLSPTSSKESVTRQSRSSPPPLKLPPKEKRPRQQSSNRKSIELASVPSPAKPSNVKTSPTTNLPLAPESVSPEWILLRQFKHAQWTRAFLWIDVASGKLYASSTGRVTARPIFETALCGAKLEALGRAPLFNGTDRVTRMYQISITSRRDGWAGLAFSSDIVMRKWLAVLDYVSRRQATNFTMNDEVNDHLQRRDYGLSRVRERLEPGLRRLEAGRRYRGAATPRIRPSERPIHTVYADAGHEIDSEIGTEDVYTEASTEDVESKTDAADEQGKLLMQRDGQSPPQGVHSRENVSVSHRWQERPFRSRSSTMESEIFSARSSSFSSIGAKSQDLHQISIKNRKMTRDAERAVNIMQQGSTWHYVHRKPSRPIGLAEATLRLAKDCSFLELKTKGRTETATRVDILEVTRVARGVPSATLLNAAVSACKCFRENEEDEPGESLISRMPLSDVKISATDAMLANETVNCSLLIEYGTGATRSRLEVLAPDAGMCAVYEYGVLQVRKVMASHGRSNCGNEQRLIDFQS